MHHHRLEPMGCKTVLQWRMWVLLDTMRQPHALASTVSNIVLGCINKRVAITLQKVNPLLC